MSRRKKYIQRVNWKVPVVLELIICYNNEIWARGTNLNRGPWSGGRICLRKLKPFLSTRMYIVPSANKQATKQRITVSFVLIFIDKSNNKRKQNFWNYLPWARTRTWWLAALWWCPHYQLCTGSKCQPKETALPSVTKHLVRYTVTCTTSHLRLVQP